MPKVKVGDISLNYEIIGEGSPVLLVTGLGADSMAWAMNVPGLMGSHKVVTVDNRGMGQSDKPTTPYTTELMADDTIALLRHLDLGPVHLVGQSLGGMICQHVALKAPELLRSLALVTTIARVPQAGELLTDLWTRNLEELGIEAFTDFVIIFTMGSEYIENNYEGVKVFRQMMLDYWKMNPVDPVTFRRQVEASLGHDVLDRLGAVSTPTLVLAGEADILTPPRFSEQIAAKIPGAEYSIMKGAAHGLNVEQPARFNQVLLDWFAKN